MSKMLVLTLLWAHGAVAARPSADQLLDRLSTEPGPQQEWTSWGHSKNPSRAMEEALKGRMTPSDMRFLGIIPSDMRYKIEQALKDLGIKATQKQRDELHERLSSAGIGEGSDVSHEEYVKLVKMFMPLDVTASAVAFCSDLVKGVTEGKKIDAQLEPSFGIGKSHFVYTKPNSGQLGRKMFEQADRRLGRFHPQQLTALAAKDIKKEADKFKGLCPEILTGSLDKGESVPKWALEAASWSQPRGEHHKLGRLDKVKAVKGSHWKVTFERVCKDECEALVDRIQEKAKALYEDFTQKSQKQKTVEQSCADHIVKHVESEILGCCSRSCGWNDQTCAFWPFLSSTEKAEWQAECCTELNVLDGSTRELMCNSTLTDEEKNEVIRDGRPNTPNDRKILGMDLYGNSALQTHSFLQNQKSRRVDSDSCQPPIDLHKKHEEWKENWKRMLEDDVVTDGDCKDEEKKNVAGCTAFVTMEANGPYFCRSGCKIKKPVNPLENLDDEAQGSTAYLYIHKNISSAWS